MKAASSKGKQMKGLAAEEKRGPNWIVLDVVMFL